VCTKNSFCKVFIFLKPNQFEPLPINIDPDFPKQYDILRIINSSVFITQLPHNALSPQGGGPHTFETPEVMEYLGGDNIRMDTREMFCEGVD
jgi:hypothetical protein